MDRLNHSFSIKTMTIQKYLRPKVTYSDPKVTQSDPTHLPLPPPTSHLANIRPLVKCIETSGWVVGGGGWVATNFNVSSRQGFKLKAFCLKGHPLPILA